MVQLLIERQRSKDLEYPKQIAEANIKSLEEELTKLRTEHQRAVAERDKLQVTAKQRDTRKKPLRRQNKELEKQIEELRKSHQKKLESADQLRTLHQQEADTMARRAETALEERDRAQEAANTLQAQVQAFTERIKNLEDKIHHATFENKRLETELRVARLDAIRTSTPNPRYFVQEAMNVSGIQEQPEPPLAESVGPLDHIIQGFQPPPPDFQANPRIEQFTGIRAQLEALEANHATASPTVPAAPVELNEGVEDALNRLAVQPGVQAQLPFEAHDPAKVSAEPVQEADVNAWPNDATRAAATNQQPVPAHDVNEWPAVDAEPMDAHPEPAPQLPVQESAHAIEKTSEQQLKAM